MLDTKDWQSWIEPQIVGPSLLCFIQVITKINVQKPRGDILDLENKTYVLAKK